MNREEPKDRPLVSSAVNILKSRMSWLGATAVALISGATALVTNVENLKSHAQAYIEERTFFAGLQHPYPALLKKEDIEQWSSGRAQLAIFQIEGYRGKLKESPAWIKLCLTSSLIFPETAKTQFNNRIEQAESFTDRQNKLNLEHRLDQLDNDKSEESETLTINDPFSKLLARSKSQLLSRYKDSEISQLDKARAILASKRDIRVARLPVLHGKAGKVCSQDGLVAVHAAIQAGTHLSSRTMQCVFSPATPP